MKEYDLTIIMVKDEKENFLALCPALQGCYADGDTLEEAISTIKDVIRMHIEDRLESGETIPIEVYSSQLKIAV